MSNSGKVQAQQNLHRATISSLFGSIIEWYDFFLYGVVAGLVFDKLYFPGENEFVSTMLAYGTFALGFVARPLGGIIFGHFGEYSRAQKNADADAAFDGRGHGRNWSDSHL